MSRAIVTLVLLCAVAAVHAEEVLNFDASTRSCVAHAHSSWGYYGQLSRAEGGTRQEILLPNDWGLRYEACGRSRAPLHRQSPIGLPEVEDLTTDDDEVLTFLGDRRTRVLVEHNCHTVQSTLVEGSDRRMVLSGQEYRLLQFHVHTPSEHVTISGERGSSNYPGEIHLVHAALDEDGDLDSSRLAVLGVFVDVAPTAPIPAVDAFFARMARDYAGAATRAGAPIELELDSLVRAGQSFWRYQGSLTTPPCSEIVEWAVLREPLIISLDTYRALEEAKLDVGIANSRPPALPTSQHALRFARP